MAENQKADKENMVLEPTKYTGVEDGAMNCNKIQEWKKPATSAEVTAACNAIRRTYKEIDAVRRTFLLTLNGEEREELSKLVTRSVEHERK